MNTPEQGILKAALDAFRRTTGLRPVLTGKSRSADSALIQIPTDRRPARFAVEIKAVDRFRTPAHVKAQIADRGERPLLVAPFISRDIAEHCRDLHLSFMDTAGNAFLEAPGLYVYVTGQPRPENAGDSRFRALGAAGLQVTFALLSRPALAGAPYREIAQAASTALGSITNAMRDLEARGFLIGEKRRRLLDPARLLEEWVTHYPIALRPKLHPRRFDAPPELVARADLASLGAYWGGESAAERLTGLLKPGAFTVYAPKSINRLVAALRLRAQPAGKVEVLETFWNFEPHPEYPDLAPPILVYADLLSSGDGRNIEAARQIYEQRIEPAFAALTASD